MILLPQSLTSLMWLSRLVTRTVFLRTWNVLSWVVVVLAVVTSVVRLLLDTSLALADIILGRCTTMGMTVLQLVLTFVKVSALATRCRHLWNILPPTCVGALMVRDLMAMKILIPLCRTAWVTTPCTLHLDRWHMVGSCSLRLSRPEPSEWTLIATPPPRRVVLFPLKFATDPITVVDAKPW